MTIDKSAIMLTQHCFKYSDDGTFVFCYICNDNRKYKSTEKMKSHVRSNKHRKNLHKYKCEHYLTKMK